MTRILNILLLVMTFTSASSVFAQATLPQGIGMYGFQYRKYLPISDSYDAGGNKQTLGESYSQEFNGPNLLEGAGGSDLQLLAEQLKKFDANNNGSNSLLNSLRLGYLNVDVEANIDSKTFVLGYGVTKYITGFFAIPWVDATVDVDINYINNNNIGLIRQRMGELAFEDLKSGFARAETINTQQVIDSIEMLGYNKIEQWSYQGLGDILTGGIFALRVPVLPDLAVIHNWRTTFLIPTGYYDDPNTLTDVSIGRGYYVLTNQYTPYFVFSNAYQFGLGLSYGYGLPTTMERRLPEQDESLVDADRLTTVDMTPGSDFGYNLSFSYVPYSLKPFYTVGVAQHTRDVFSGSRDGNYDKLAEGSDTYVLYHEPGIEFNTVDLYEKGRFFMPFIATLKGHLLLAARNSIDERYVEATFSSFFITPFASTDLKKDEQSAKRKKLMRSHEYRLVEKRKAREKKSKIAH